MYVICIGCNCNCDLETTNDRIFCDMGDETYECHCYCPYGGFEVEVEEDKLKKAWNYDHGVDEDDSFDKEEQI